MPRTAVAYLSPSDAAPGPWPADAEVIRVIREGDPHGRAGLREALEVIAASRAEVLLVARLEATAHSLTELTRLLDWLEAHRASLVALDLRLDTGHPDCRRTVLVLREIERWAREPEAPRRRRGRPGIETVSPELAERIARLRERGLSLHAIADALSAEGIPTPRGGARWRASSVQSALGYRRPRPPAPGVPPSGPPPPRGPHGGRPRKAPAPPGAPGPPPQPKRKGSP